MPSSNDTLLAEVDCGIAECQSLHVGPRASQHRVHSGQKFVDVKRFGYVIVRTEIESPELVGLLSPGGQHDDRSGAAPPQRAEQLEAGRIREHEIEEDEIGM